MAELSKEQAEHEAAGGLSRTGPLFRAVALRQMDDLRERLVAGDDWSLVLAMNLCAIHDVAMPDWVATEWLRRSRSVLHYRVGTWDAVMPAATPKGAKLHALRLSREWTLRVVQAIYGARQRGESVSDALFDEIAERERWPFTGSKGKQLYYRAKKSFGPALSFYFDAPSRASTSRRKS